MNVSERFAKAWGAMRKAQRDTAYAMMAADDGHVETTRARIAEALAELAEVSGQLDLIAKEIADYHPTSPRTPLVHILFHGRPLCDCYPGLVPGEWPAGERWTGPTEPEVATCGKCRDVWRHQEH